MSEQRDITELGNPARPTGQAGQQMLMRMAESHRQVTDWGLSFADIKDGESVLDVGCGSGMAIKRIADKYERVNVYGIDYSETSTALSKENLSKYIEDGRAHISCASVEELPYEDESFDAVYTVESFYFWPDHIKGLKEIKRVLIPGGKFLLIADIYDTSDLDAHQRENIKKYNLYNPTLEKFEQLLKDAGYTDVEVHTKEGTTWV